MKIYYKIQILFLTLDLLEPFIWLNVDTRNSTTEKDLV